MTGFWGSLAGRRCLRAALLPILIRCWGDSRLQAAWLVPGVGKQLPLRLCTLLQQTTWFVKSWTVERCWHPSADKYGSGVCGVLFVEPSRLCWLCW